MMVAHGRNSYKNVRLRFKDCLIDMQTTTDSGNDNFPSDHERFQKKQKLSEMIAVLVTDMKRKGVDQRTIQLILHESFLSSGHFESCLFSSLSHQRQKRAIPILLVLASVVFLLQFSLSAWEWMQLKPCLLYNNEFFMQTVRPPSNCSSLCQGLDRVRVEVDLNQQDFAERYAYIGRPVLVKNVTQDWTALRVFNFSYFKDIFDANSELLDKCIFFPYHTDFESLAEFFEMPPERATFQTGQEPWYVGWSNCVPEIAAKLRQHYQRPSFLPPDSEVSIIDWIFMGGFGRGAHIHIDAVKRPSWQAMIAGRKTWTLIPPTECEHVCQVLNVTMETGDIYLTT